MDVTRADYSRESAHSIDHVIKLLSVVVLSSVYIAYGHVFNAGRCREKVNLYLINLNVLASC